MTDPTPYAQPATPPTDAGALTSAPFDPTVDTGDVVVAPAVDGPAPLPAADRSELKVGGLIEHTYFDPYSGAGGQEVTDIGMVTHIDEDGAARVCWLTSSDPIPASELSPL